MADSPVFDRTCEELDERTSLERIEVRGTVRIALKKAGLDARSVDATQMGVVLRKVLPGELDARGVEESAAVCDQIAAAIDGMASGGVGDRAGTAAATMDRLGS